MIFSKRGTNKQKVKFDYNGVNIDIVKTFTYLHVGVVLNTGGSFSETITKTRLFKYIENFTTKN